MVPTKIADEYTSIREGLARIEEERQRKLNPPLQYDPTMLAGVYAWKVIQMGRLQSTHLWHESDDLRVEYDFTTRYMVLNFLEWLNSKKTENIDVIATEAFVRGDTASGRDANLKIMYCRLRVLKLL